MQTISGKNVKVVEPFNLYKWIKSYKRLQDKFWGQNTKMRRIKQIEDFITLNNYKKVCHKEQVLIDLVIPTVEFIDDISKADLLLKTDQRYDRYTNTGLIEQINSWLDACPDLYICLNRCYINIANEKIDMDLPDDFLQAITYWLRESLKDTATVVDLSWNYVEEGHHFSWNVPDRHYFIKRK